MPLAEEPISSVQTSTISTTTKDPFEYDPFDMTHYHEDMAWLKINDTNKCKETFDKLKEETEEWEEFEFFSPPHARYEDYKLQLQELFANSTINVTAVGNYQTCLGNEELCKEIKEVIEQILDQGIQMRNAASFSEAYKHGKDIGPLYFDLSVNKKDQYDTVTNAWETCGWYREYLTELREEDEHAHNQFDKMKEDLDIALREFRSISGLFRNLFDELKNTIYPTLQYANKYLQGDLRKKDLSDKLQEMTFLRAVERLPDINTEFSYSTKDYKEIMEIAHTKLKLIYEKLFQLRLPIFNPYTVNNLEIVKQAEAIDDAVLKVLTNLCWMLCHQTSQGFVIVTPFHGYLWNFLKTCFKHVIAISEFGFLSGYWYQRQYVWHHRYHILKTHTTCGTHRSCFVPPSERDNCTNRTFE